MQPVKIAIAGNYYDCQIYRGKLYLWTFKGSLAIYDWDTFVHSLILNNIDFKNQLVPKEIVKKYLISEQNTPGGILPTDTEIYNNKLYFINDEGFFLVHSTKIVFQSTKLVLNRKNYGIAIFFQ